MSYNRNPDRAVKNRLAIIVYLDCLGFITHTGVVRKMDRNGNPTLIESKWGDEGLRIHEPDDSPYIKALPGSSWNVYVKLSNF